MNDTNDLMRNVDTSRVPKGHRLVPSVNNRGELVLTMYRRKNWFEQEIRIPRNYQDISSIQRAVNELSA